MGDGRDGRWKGCVGIPEVALSSIFIIEDKLPLWDSEIVFKNRSNGLKLYIIFYFSFGFYLLILLMCLTPEFTIFPNWLCLYVHIHHVLIPWSLLNIALRIQLKCRRECRHFEFLMSTSQKLVKLNWKPCNLVIN